MYYMYLFSFEETFIKISAGMTLTGKHAVDRRYQFRVIQSQPNLLQSVNNSSVCAGYKQTSDIKLILSNNSTDKQSIRPKTAHAGLQTTSDSRKSRPNTAASRIEQKTAEVKERPKSGVLKRHNSYSMPGALLKNTNHQQRHLLSYRSRIQSARSNGTDFTTSSTEESQKYSGHAGKRRRPYSAVEKTSEDIQELLSSRGSEFSLENNAAVDIIHKVRQQSCRRRSERLDAKTRREIISAHRRTPEEKIRDYYEMLKEKKAKELDVATRKARARKRFSEAIWKVLWIIRWKRVMIAISLDNMTMTAMEMDWHTRNTDTTESQFKKEDFSRQRITTKVPDWAEKILRKPPEWRSPTECNKLHALLRPLKSFEKFTEKIQMAMCQSMRYEFVNSKRIVLREGHPGYCFYFIFSGSVFVNIKDTTKSGEVFTKTAAILRRGESFGELALLREASRAATITCREDTELLTVDKEVFASICPAIFEIELNEKFTFLKSLPILLPNLWSDAALSNLCTEAQIKQYKNSKVVVADNSQEEWLYICMEGKCKVVKALKFDKSSNGGPRLKSQDIEEKEQVDKVFSQITNEQNNDLYHRNSQIAQMISNHRPAGGEFKAKVSKVRMLNSMALDWFKAHEQIDEMKRKHRMEEIENNRIISGMKTFTTLMADMREKAKADGCELMFIEVAQLDPLDIFDLQAILTSDYSSDSSGSKLILVSSGAKMLRIKRSDFFRSASFEALEYMKTTTADESYPNDRELYKRYSEINSWNQYKSQSVHGLLNLRDTAFSNQAKSVMSQLEKERQIQNAKMMKILKANEDIEKRNSLKQEVEAQRNLFQFEVDKVIKENEEEARRESMMMLHKAESFSIKPQRVRRNSATGALPNLIEQLVLEGASLRNQQKQEKHPKPSPSNSHNYNIQLSAQV